MRRRQQQLSTLTWRAGPCGWTATSRSAIPRCVRCTLMHLPPLALLRGRPCHVSSMAMAATAAIAEPINLLPGTTATCRASCLCPPLLADAFCTSPLHLFPPAAAAGPVRGAGPDVRSATAPHRIRQAGMPPASLEASSFPSLIIAQAMPAPIDRPAPLKPSSLCSSRCCRPGDGEPAEGRGAQRGRAAANQCGGVAGRRPQAHALPGAHPHGPPGVQGHALRQVQGRSGCSWRQLHWLALQATPQVACVSPCSLSHRAHANGACRSPTSRSWETPKRWPACCCRPGPPC